MDTDIKIAYKRMILGAAIGFLLFFFAAIALLYINGWFSSTVQQYAGPPPLMTSLVFGFLGFVFGALFGLLKIRKIKLPIVLLVFFIILIGGFLPLLPNSWFANFPAWFENTLLGFGGAFLVLFMFLGFMES